MTFMVVLPLNGRAAPASTAAEAGLSRDSPDGRRIERDSASLRFPLQGEAVALADRRVVTHGRGPFCAKSNDFSVIWTHLPLSFCSNARQPNTLRRCWIRRRSKFRDHLQDVSEEISRNGDFGHLKRDKAATARRALARSRESRRLFFARADRQRLGLRREVDFLPNHPKNFASSRAGQSQKPDALAIVAKRVCEACQTAESSESDRTRSKHPFRAEAREYHLQEYQYSYCLATAALASSRTSLRDHGFEVNRTPPGRTMFETGLPDVTRTST